MYTDICKMLEKCSRETIDAVRSSNLSGHIVPGWNDCIKDLHAEARNAYILWRNLGKPRGGPIFELMRHSRLSFKYALRRCKRQVEMAKADAIAKDFNSKNVREFWKKVQKTQNSRIPLPTNVDGCVSKEDVANMWQTH